MSGKIGELQDLSHDSGKLGTYWALVIGIQDYQDPAIPDLGTAPNDARALADLLKSRYGFFVELLLDHKATKQAIYNTLQSIRASVQPQDSVLIYYAGHGKLDRHENCGWWIPADAAAGDAGTYLDNALVQKAISGMPARHVLLISDSCYADALFGKEKTMPPVIDDRDYLGLYNAKSRWAMTSTNMMPVTGGHSGFAGQLIKALADNDKPIFSTQQLCTHIAAAIANKTAQAPLCGPIHDSGDQGGEFLFIASVGAQAEAPKKIRNSLGMEFAYIEPCTFAMGSPVVERGRYEDEQLHKVMLTQGYYLQTTEVTQNQWRAVMGSNPSFFKNCGDDCPVETVSWDEVQDFIAKLNQKEGGGYRLPTEAEWEHAARSGSTTAFSSGGISELDCSHDRNLEDMGWYCGSSGVTYSGCYHVGKWDGPECVGIHPVAKKQPNAWGLYDMHGNVWEWCQDWYEDYPPDDVIDPQGPSSGSHRVIRGGSWFNEPRDCRSAKREGFLPDSGSGILGLRLVRDLDLDATSSARAGLSVDIKPALSAIEASCGIPRGRARLYVATDPADAFVKIQNIESKFYQGIELAPGRYQVQVAAKGLETKTLWVTLGAGEGKHLDIYLNPPAITQALAIGEAGKGKKLRNSLGMEFVYIEPGTFTMGSSADEQGRRGDERQHKVTLTRGYYLQSTEVTQAQWRAVMGSNPAYFKNCGEDCPVETVFWDEVQDFIDKLNAKEEGSSYRLPTEAEWEYAARAGSTTAFANGRITDLGCGPDRNLDAIGWYCGNSGVTYSGCYDVGDWNKEKCSGTHPVAQKHPNAWGLYDMHGNVMELCQDWYGDYPQGSVTDPQGPSSGSLRVIRGGRWASDARQCRSAYRDGIGRGEKYDFLGFRLTKSQ